jgi:hypothetical protein
MLKSAMMATAAALLAAATAAPAGADLRGLEAADGDHHAQLATMLARQINCGGPHLRCPAGYAKVCNPKNNTCCCAIAGTYH